MRNILRLRKKQHFLSARLSKRDTEMANCEARVGQTASDLGGRSLSHPGLRMEKVT